MRLNAVMRSRTVRWAVSTLEEKLPPLRAWHRFEYEQHFGLESDWARMFSGVYDSFESARSAAPKGARTGHDHQETAQRQISETGQMWLSDYPVLFWMKSLLRENTKVFDLGGGPGITFFVFRKYLVYPKSLVWKVCDVPAVVQRGTDLTKSERAEELCFTSNIEDADGADLVLASGSLQFIETPLSLTLSKLTSKPPHVLINRTPLCDGTSFTTLNNIGKAFCPYQIRSKEEFVRGFESIGYSLADLWETPEFSCYIPFHPERSVKVYSGMYFRLDK
ncbi:MAG TPA: TIGR04325 family methyltransferase [Candidatus Binataceae bacterium]